MKIAGIDYSLRGPAICVFDGDKRFTFKDCKFYFLTHVKKREGQFLSNIFGTLFDEYTNESQRYDQISQWALNIVSRCELACIEDYAFAAKGKVFHIGENTGILKWKMWRNDLPFETVPPSLVKKFATGRGNAKKEEMYNSFVNETGVNLHSLLTPDLNSIKSPISDIVDAYYICKYLHNDISS
jgi:Holliday junction resolvasome RuvABC endonuclease subunit